jgi:membrane protein DedA with SNARE-associated domain
MSELLAQIVEFVQELVITGSYPGIVFVMFAENVFPPIPSEVIMPLAGYLVSTGDFNFVGIVLAGTLGSVLGAIVLYYVGAWVGEPIMRSFVRRYGRFFTISENDFDRALKFFDKYGEVVIFFGRLIPVIRSIISIPAGMDRMPMSRFLFFTTLGTAIWSGLLGYAGYALGENWTRVEGFMEQYQDVVIVICVVLLALFVAWRFNVWRTRRAAGITAGATAGAGMVDEAAVE